MIRSFAAIGMKTAPALALLSCMCMSAAFPANADGKRSVTTQEAIQIFDQVCGKSLPRFTNAQARTEALGLVFRKDSNERDIRVNAAQLVGGEYICYVQYGSAEQLTKLKRSLEALGDLQVTSPRSALVKYRNTKHMLEIDIQEQRVGGRAIVSLEIKTD